MVSRKWRAALACVVMTALVVAGLSLLKSRQEPKPIAEGDLGDGRIFVIEGVSFGTRHQAGTGSPILEKLGTWAPRKVRELLEPRVPKSTIARDEPALVIWVSALDATFRTNVDCQGVRMELRDSTGMAYNEHQPNWFGFEKYWRVGHVFSVFPRHEKTLKLTVATWRGSNQVNFEIPNPGFTHPALLAGSKPPLRHKQGRMEVVLTALDRDTTKAEYWRAAAEYWKPEFELWRDGRKEESGWDLEWNAEDAWGNRGQYLGLNKPVLKFSATFYPSGTNTEAAVLITNTPVSAVGPATNWWNLQTMVTTNKVELLGLFPPGVHTFSEGELLTNPPTTFRPVGGGAPTGWVWSSQATPLKRTSYHGHYSDVPVVYVRVADPTSKQRIAVLLRDSETGASYLAEPEPQGIHTRIAPFLVKLPPEVKKISAELLLLPPVHAEFMVETPAATPTVKVTSPEVP